MVADEIDWLQVIYGNDGSVNRSLEYVAKHQFPHDELLADEAYTSALHAISENDFAKLSKFRNEAKPSTYLIRCFTNLIRDFSRAKFGRCSPPEWLKALGPVYVNVHRKLCCEHVNKADILRGQQPGKGSETDLESIIQRICRSIPSCLSKPTPGSIKVNVEDYDELDRSSASHQNEQAPDLELGSESIISALWLFICPDQAQVNGEQMAKLGSLQATWLPELTLTTDQKLLLRRVKVEGASVRDAAAELRLEYHTARRELMRAVKAMRDVFDKAGISEDELR